MIKHSIKSNLAEVRVIANKLHQFCTDQNLNETISGQLEIILVEAVNNVIEHAYQEKTECPIDIIFESKPTQVIITIIDQGIAPPASTYNQESTTLPEVGDLPEGGWGISLIHSLADQVAYHRENNKNILSIRKNTINM